MEFQLDRELRIVFNSEQNMRDRWVINEIDGNGKVIGGDYSPWDWTLSFTVTEITLQETTEVTKTSKSSPVDAAHRRVIRASLSPRSDIDDIGLRRQPKYQMFGADRNIENFLLRVLPLTSEEEIETCSAYGSVSFTAEGDDFLPETDPDVIEFSLMVRPSTYDGYAKHIAAATADEMIFSVRGVAGFYSEWSPTVLTRNVKVLTQGDEHQSLKLPSDFNFIIPRLGSYLTATLQINTKRQQARELPISIDDDAPVKADQRSPLVHSAYTATTLVPDPRAVTLLSSLKAAAYWIIALLALLLITTLLKQ